MLAELTSADELIERLRERAADPARRTDALPNTLLAGGQAVDLASLVEGAGGIAGMFGQLRALAGQDPARTSDMAARLNDTMAKLQSPKAAPLPPPATAAALERAERAIGQAFPPLLRRAYLEIADGGFGPGFGLHSLKAAARTYEDLRDETPGPPGTSWPEALVPIVGDEAAYECVDLSTGAIVAYDGEELLEHWDPDQPDAAAAERGWKACFSTRAPTVEAWLEKWVGAPTAS